MITRDATARTLRTAAQLGAAETVIQLLIAFNAPITDRQHVALLAFGALVITLVLNLLEDNTDIPAVGKPGPPPVGPAQNPVAAPAPGE